MREEIGRVLPNETNANRAQRIAKTVAQARDANIGDLPDVLRSVVGTEGTQSVYFDALAHLSDPNFLSEHIVDEGKRMKAFVEFSLSRASQLRRTCEPTNVEKAREVIDTLLAAAPEPQGPSDLKDLSTAFYERGYVSYLRGETAQAHLDFEESRRKAREAGAHDSDRITELVDLRMEMLKQFSEGEISSEFETRYRDQLKEAIDFFQTPEGGQNGGWVLNCHHHLLGLAVLTNNTEEAARHLTAIENAWGGKPNADTALRMPRAQAALCAGAFGEACGLYGQALDNLTDPLPRREDLAGHLLNYGRALHGNGRIAEAKAIWQKAWDCPEPTAGWAWKPHVSKQLRELDAGGEKPRTALDMPKPTQAPGNGLGTAGSRSALR